MNALTQLAVVVSNERSSDSIAAEINRLQDDLDRGQERLTFLASTYDAAILKGDKEAEANETETTVTKRTVRRVELRLGELKSELERALDFERASQLRKKQDDASAAVASVIAEMDAQYRKPAATIAEFLKELAEANKLASDAGVPSVHQQTRYIPAQRGEDREGTQTYYIDEQGCESDSPYPAGSYSIGSNGERIDATTNRAMTPRQARTRVVTVPGKVTAEVWLDGLDTIVNLPGATMQDTDHWQATSLQGDRKRR